MQLYQQFPLKKLTKHDSMTPRSQDLVFTEDWIFMESSALLIIY
jgi:hypothetical protein